MADTKISALTAVVTPADSDEYVVNQAGTTKKLSRTQVFASHLAAADPHAGYVLESAAGTIHTQNANGVAITGGTITGITDLAVADGGTGASTASGARTNLGLVIGTDVQAHSAVLAATTASFLTADETKLDGIEALADVTDATNVAAAGAVMEADTSTAAMQFVIDEDNMASDSATKVPTQQSVKAYVDASGGGASALDDLSDVVITSPSNGEVIKFDGANWINDADDTGSGATNLTWTAATSVVASDTGTDATLTAVDDTNPGLMTVAMKSKLDGIEASADVTDTANVTAAGALMDSEVDADIKTLALPANTTISTFGASLIDDAAASNARTTLGLVIGTDVASVTALNNHINDTSDAHDASAISYAGGTGMSATDVEAAIDELATEKVSSTDVVDIVEISAASYSALGAGRPAGRLYLITS